MSFLDLLNEVVSNEDWKDIRESEAVNSFYEDKEEVNEIDLILETVLQRMRSLQEDIGNTSVDDLVASVMKERESTSRVKRDAKGDNVQVAESRSNDELVPGLVKALSERSHLSSNAQTVGSLLATIPGILEDHGVSFDSISKHLFNFEKSLENTLESGLSNIAETIKQTAKETAGENVKSLENTIESGFSKNADKLGEMGETLHNGLDLMVDKMDYNANIEETLHEGFHSISEKLEDKTKIDDTIHDGLHEISEKIETINSYGLTGIINSLDDHDHHTYPAGHGPNDGHDHGHSYGHGHGGHGCKYLIFQHQCTYF